jgi:hypothetical protein
MNCVNCDHPDTTDTYVSDIDFIQEMVHIKVRSELCRYCYRALSNRDPVTNIHTGDEVTVTEVRNSIYEVENKLITEKKDKLNQ